MPESYGEIARREVSKRGLLFFPDVLQDLKVRLKKTKSFTVVGAACAERLLTQHLRQPASQIRPFTAAWRAPLESIWEALKTGERPASKSETLSFALNRYASCAASLEDEEYDSDDADEDAAAACASACESFIKQDSDAAFRAASRLIDYSFERINVANDQGLGRCINAVEFTEDCCSALIQAELQWLLELLSNVEGKPVNAMLVEELRKQAVERPFQSVGSNSIC